MGLLSSSVSITRYTIEGKIQAPIFETVANGLTQNTIIDIDHHAADKAVGWTTFENPYQPDFKKVSFVFGNYFVFSLRIDRKKISQRILKKHYEIQSTKRLAESGRGYISQNEKKMIKDSIINALNLRMPSIPNVYNLIWNYEEAHLCFFSNLKAANEELETLFSKSFKLTLIRLFPYTAADLMLDLSDSQRDDVRNLSACNFTE